MSLNLWPNEILVKKDNNNKQTKKKKTFYTRKTLCRLLANINSTAANMAQSVICIWDG